MFTKSGPTEKMYDELGPSHMIALQIKLKNQEIILQWM